LRSAERNGPGSAIRRRAASTCSQTFLEKDSPNPLVEQIVHDALAVRLRPGFYRFEALIDLRADDPASDDREPLVMLDEIAEAPVIGQL